jgi:hypothetical protein
MVVSHLSRYMSDPSQSYWEQAKRVLRYLKGTTYSVLMYGRAPSSKLIGWSDSDYASKIWRAALSHGVCVHAQRCNGEMAATMYGAVVRGGRVYGAECGHSGGGVFKQLLHESHQGFGSPITIHEDNQSCIALSKKNMTTGRNKHMDVRYHFCREKVESGDIDVQ